MRFLVCAFGPAIVRSLFAVRCYLLARYGASARILSVHPIFLMCRLYQFCPLFFQFLFSFLFTIFSFSILCFLKNVTFLVIFNKNLIMYYLNIHLVFKIYYRVIQNVQVYL